MWVFWEGRGKEKHIILRAKFVCSHASLFIFSSELYSELLNAAEQDVWLHSWKRSVVDGGETWTFAIPCYIHILWQDKKHHRSDVGCSLLQIWLKPDQTALKGFHQIASLKTQTTLLGHPQVIRNSPGVSFECEGKSFWQESFCCFRSWRLQSLV